MSYPPGNLSTTAALSRTPTSGVNKHTYFLDADVEDKSKTENERHGLKKKKRRRRSPVSETLTIAPEPPRLPSPSNQFAALRASAKLPHQEKQRRRKLSSRVELHREWSYASGDFSGFRDRLVVVSYNILGVENASKHPDLYSGIPPKFLEWKRRKRLIHKEACLYDASILCFQEVELFDDLAVLLRKDGYDGSFKVKQLMGVLYFGKNKQFTLVYEDSIEFKAFGLRDNVAQLCVLKVNQTDGNTNLPARSSKCQPNQGRHVLIGNVHMLFNPNRGDIKLGQIRLFLEKAYKLSKRWGGIPVILGGDLNSLPQLDIRLQDCRSISGQIAGQSFSSTVQHYRTMSRPFVYRWTDEELMLAAGSYRVTSLSHRLKLCSAYAAIPGMFGCRDKFGEPIVTSYHSSFMGTVDYIWHSEGLVPVRVLETPPVDTLRRRAELQLRVLLGRKSLSVRESPTEKEAPGYLSIKSIFSSLDSDIIC